MFERPVSAVQRKPLLTERIPESLTARLQGLRFRIQALAQASGLKVTGVLNGE